MYSLREEKLYTLLGERLKDLFIKLGGVYIKLGQFLSNLIHILPEVFTSRLQDLQDRLPAHSFEEIEERFKKEFQVSIETAFPQIEKIPLASASMAQVHIAWINEQKVAVKILYPDIEKVVEKDLKTILFIMKRLNRLIFHFDYRRLHREVEESISREMDLSLEAEAILKMTRLFQNEKDIIFPEVYHKYISKGVLVTRFVEGVKISDTLSARYKNSKRSKPLALLLRAYILMIFKHRFFHADPHPGNLIYTPEGKLCFIDFGSVGQIPESMQQGLRKLLVSAVRQDYYGVIDSMEDMGFFSTEANKEQLEQIAKYAIESLNKFTTDTEYFRNISLEQMKPGEMREFLKGINTSLGQLLKIARIPPNYILLERVFAMLVGHAAWLDPYRTVFDYAKQPFFSLVGGDESRLAEIAREEGMDIAADALSLPSDLHHALVKLNRGRITFRNSDIEKQTRVIEILVHQLIYTALFLGLLHFGNFFFEKK
ncbi:MAG: AarF/ABC1/UbiB kinase family protein, partial [Leptospiraceae bacterium]|nr:AarF/ABC1/UbiB kinase family protein [Leptospiraceae bacterium]